MSSTIFQGLRSSFKYDTATRTHQLLVFILAVLFSSVMAKADLEVSALSLTPDLNDASTTRLLRTANSAVGDNHETGLSIRGLEYQPEIELSDQIRRQADQEARTVRAQYGDNKLATMLQAARTMATKLQKAQFKQ